MNTESKTTSSEIMDKAKLANARCAELEDRVSKLEKGMDGLTKFINENMAHKPLLFG